MPEYRIEFTITGRGPDDEDFKEIGFGSSGVWRGVDAALNDVDAIVQNRLWETLPDMPDPKEVDQ